MRRLKFMSLLMSNPDLEMEILKTFAVFFSYGLSSTRKDLHFIEVFINLVKEPITKFIIQFLFFVLHAK